MSALPKVMVLEYQPELTHSVWVDLRHGCRTKSGLAKVLRNGMQAGDWTGYRLITEHAQSSNRDRIAMDIDEACEEIAAKKGGAS